MRKLSFQQFKQAVVDYLEKKLAENEEEAAGQGFDTSEVRELLKPVYEQLQCAKEASNIWQIIEAWFYFDPEDDQGIDEVEATEILLSLIVGQ